MKLRRHYSIQIGMAHRLLCLLIGLLALSTPLRAQIAAVDSVGFTVSDMDRSVDFFTRVLSFEKTSDNEVAGTAYQHLQGVFGLRMRVVALTLGDESIELTESLAPRGRPIPLDSRSHDRWFQHCAIVVSDMDRAYQHLRRHEVEHASSGPQTLPDWNPAAGGIRAFYFRDPDGHHLEIIEFPPDKGDPKWQREQEGLFLGIDHTAIVTGDTGRSLKFYRDVLGMRVAGESENYGTEQEHLNNVFGARLRITALRAAGGPGIELLEYLAPSDGKPFPQDARANDLVHWQTTLIGDRLAAAEARLRAARATLISPGIVPTNARELGFAEGLLARDPDGHALRIVEKR
jgi:catechol 2,3-dioxygenase-like lactoylglutathione lyase family enzyme